MDDLLRGVEVVEGESSTIVKYIDAESDDYVGFGEIYFCKIQNGVDRGWKIHALSTCNLMVPVGEVAFVVADLEMSTYRFYRLGQERMQRLLIPPLHWYRFVAESEPYAVIANLLDIADRQERHTKEQIELNSRKPASKVEWMQKRIIKE